MATTDWLSSRLRPGPRSQERLPGALAGAARAATRGVAKPSARTTHERLAATLRKADEALSPRALRKVLTALQAVIDSRVSEVEGGRRAQAVALEYAAAAPGARHDFWALMSEHFAADARELEFARNAHQAAAGTADAGEAEMRLRRALVSPRMRLLQRFAVEPDGMRFLVDLRAELLPHLKSDKRLLALDAELEQLFSTWFDVAFLELRRIDWDSPASLIEKLIRYEAVHDIRGWADVKNRLDHSDRRCYGFFHPRLPNEPLIFVEVALVDRVSAAIAPLLDEAAEVVPAARATTAVFYSISNTQAGLRGVSFGDSLIKRVVETLQAELPRLKTFATLSPIPGFRGWLARHAAALLTRLDDKRAAELGQSVGSLPPTADRVLAAVDAPGALTALDARSPLRQWLLQAAAEYLGHALVDGEPADPVARFHLGNGARVERLNWAGDLSPKGHRQAYGLMVNYLYDVKRLDKHRGWLAGGRVAVSGDVDALFLKA